MPGVLIQLKERDPGLSPAYTVTVVFMSAIRLWIGGHNVDVNINSKKIKMNGLQAFTPSEAVNPLLCSSPDNCTLYSGSGFLFKNLAATTMHIMEIIEPIMLGSSHPITCAAMNHGTVNDNEAIKTIGNTLFNALNPFPTINTMKNGDKNVKIT